MIIQRCPTVFAVVEVVSPQGELSQYAVDSKMTAPIAPLPLFALMRTFRHVLFEEGLQDLAAIAHQGAQQSFFYCGHFQRTGAGILALDRLQERFGFPVALLLGFLAFFLLSG